MGIPAIVHLQGDEAILGELDEVPNPHHNFLFMRNIRKKDGKPLPYVADGAEVFLYAWHRITFVEIMQDIKLAASGMVSSAGTGMVEVGAAKPAGTTVLGFFRDDEP